MTNVSFRFPDGSFADPNVFYLQMVINEETAAEGM